MSDPVNFFDRALAAAECAQEYVAEFGSGDIDVINQRSLVSEDVDLIVRALREAIALNKGIRAENEGLSARLRAAESRGDLPAPKKPSEALLAAARAVVAASERDAAKSIVAGYTPLELAEAGIV